jgi:hypothetical protein
MTLPTITVRELVDKLIHSAEVIAARSPVQKLDDADLLNSVLQPYKGDFIRIHRRTGNIVDGNSRAYELIQRARSRRSMITWDTIIPYQDYNPDDTLFFDDID